MQADGKTPAGGWSVDVFNTCRGFRLEDGWRDEHLVPFPGGGEDGACLRSRHGHPPTSPAPHAGFSPTHRNFCHRLKPPAVLFTVFSIASEPT